MNDKEQFLKTKYIPLLQQLSDNEVGAWGVLSPQGMIEHMTDAFGNGYGRIKLALQTQPELLERIRAFALSDKEFKPGTKNVLMSDTPAPLRHYSITEAIWELEQEITSFFDFYNSNPDHQEMNPFFGALNYEEQLHLLHKHAIHHLKQFNLF